MAKPIKEARRGGPISRALKLRAWGRRTRAIQSTCFVCGIIFPVSVESVFSLSCHCHVLAARSHRLAAMTFHLQSMNRPERNSLKLLDICAPASNAPMRRPPNIMRALRSSLARNRPCRMAASHACSTSMENSAQRSRSNTMGCRIGIVDLHSSRGRYGALTPNFYGALPRLPTMSIFFVPARRNRRYVFVR